MNGGGVYTSPPVVDQPSMEVEELDWKSAADGHGSHNQTGAAAAASGWKEANNPAVENWKEEPDHNHMVQDDDEETGEPDLHEQDAPSLNTPVHHQQPTHQQQQQPPQQQQQQQQQDVPNSN